MSGQLGLRDDHLSPDCRDGKHSACRGGAWCVDDYTPTVETTAENRARAWALRYPDCTTWSDGHAPGFAHAEVERIAAELDAHDAEVRVDQRKKDAQIVKAEIERLEVVKGTYAQGQRHVLGVVWAAIRAGGQTPADSEAGS